MGDIPSRSTPPSGCVFHTRCPLYRESLSESDKEKCRTVVPALAEKEPGHAVHCHFPIARADVAAAEDEGVLSTVDSPATSGTDAGTSSTTSGLWVSRTVAAPAGTHAIAAATLGRRVQRSPTPATQSRPPSTGTAVSSSTGRPAAMAVEFERTPPQNVEAEQSVLGGMLLSKDAIADVVEVLKSGDFYRPAHQTIFDTVLDLYGRGEPADAITVSADLQRAGDLGRVGGAPYLHTLIAGVPTAANAGYYAEIV